MIATPGSDFERFAERRQLLLDRLVKGLEFEGWCASHTDLVDELVQAVFESSLSKWKTRPELAVVATGGYGRRELAPYSDVDLTVIPMDEAAPGLDEAVKDLFLSIHSATGAVLKLEVGYAYRLVNDAPGLDAKTRTGLLDARLVAGSSEPMDALMDSFWKTFPVADFLIAKIDERADRERQTHDTPLVVEPHLKEGAGGLRSFQAANWLRVAIGERPMPRTPAYEKLLAIRNLLHGVAGRKQDVLSRQREAEIADLLQRDVYEFGADRAAIGLELAEEYRLARERLFEARFGLGGGVTVLRGEARISPKTSTSAAASGIAKATRLGLRVPEEPALTSGVVDGPDAVQALSSGEKALRNLDRCGLLAALLPELTSCKTLMPRDTAHEYTVFEHTFRMVRNLDELDPDSFLGRLKESLRDPGPLYLAVLLHDVGKLDEAKPHSEAGAEIARRIGDKWKLADATATLVEWLVAQHLTMARFIRMRDVLNPVTTQEFAAIVVDQERLDMLTLLTYADIRAVSETAWTPTQENFLQELYARTTAVLEGDAPHEPDPSVYRKRLIKELSAEEVSGAEVLRFVEALPAHYVTSTPPELVKLHMKYVRDAVAGKPVIELYHDPSLHTTELTVSCLDRPGLLSMILGVIYAYDLTIHGLRASTTQTERPTALDVFSVSFGSRPLPPATAQQLMAGLRSVLEGKKTQDELLSERGKDPTRVQNNFTYTYLEGSPSILEVQAPRGRGMAFRLSRVISGQGWDITAARVGQWAGRGAAAFYLAGPGHRPIPRSEIERALGPRV